MLSRLGAAGSTLAIAVLVTTALATAQQPPPAGSGSRQGTTSQTERSTREREPLSLPTTLGPPITSYPLELLGLVATPTQRSPVIVVPSISVSEEYNDNIFLDNRIKQSDFITGFSPALSLIVNQPWWELKAGYSFTAEIYAKESRFNDALSRQYFIASALFRPTPGLTLTLSDTFANDRSTNVTAQVSTGRQESWSNTFAPGLTYQMTPRASLSLGASYTALRFLGRGGGIDSDSYGFLSNVGYAFTQRLSGFIGYNFTYLDIELGDSSQTHNPIVGFGYQLTPTLSVTLSGGPAITLIRGDTFITPAGTAAITQLFRWGTIGLQYTRGVTPAGGFGGSSDTQSVSGTVTASTLLQGLLVTFSPAYSTSESVDDRDPNRVDVDAFTLTLNAYYQLARYASLFGGYTFLHQRTGGRSTQQVDVDQNRVRFGVQFGYPFNFD
jgi:hypothetical protein